MFKNSPDAAAHFAARSTAALKAIREMAQSDSLTVADLERADRLVTFIERVYSLTWDAAGIDGKGLQIAESIFHDRSESRFSRMEIRKGLENG